MPRILAPLVMTCLLLMAICPAAGSQPPLRIAYSTFVPFHWVDGNGAMAGLFYEIITEALEKRMKIAVTWTAYPWPRCQENLKSGVVDAILTVPMAERAVYSSTHVRPFYLKKMNIFTYAGHPRIEQIKQIRTIDDIRKNDFTVITYSGNGWHRENLTPAGVKTHEGNYVESVWKMLARKRGDMVVEWPGAWPDVRRLGLENRIVDTRITLATMPFHLLIGNKSLYKARLPEFDATIEAMHRDGTMEMILSRY